MNVKIILNQGKANLNLEDNVLILANGIKCNFNPGQCFDPTYGHTFWNV